MFPEFRGLITKLKTEDSHFARLFDKHNELDHKIKAMEAGVERTASVEIENLKKEKLRLKDQRYQIRRKAAGPAGAVVRITMKKAPRGALFSWTAP